ncbi:polysaccharide deacetylase family protein [Streptomyces sp. V17-9]|uniref:polysaccharide deacetylase family protein n=1 Tax=Streptomyces sp. V17-9 TaxID=2831149 RepID=UPI001BB094EE|nr:polysaccharide deacetylase family protein [Streptomyces sp. V17-9]QUW95472.1 Peptidoglycan-N-acetylglucosamine deacetylase [Streptomyces sp. V17-9]
MEKDQLLTRRTLLTGVAALGAAGTAGALAAGLGDGPAKPPAPAPAAGPPQRSPLKPSAYRLKPLTGYDAPSAAPRRPPVRSEPILRMTGRGRTMLLTFDDGPHPEYTPEILDTLAEHKVHATFFVCGEMAEWNRDLLARMYDEGHVVGNHTWSHPLLTKLSRRRIRSEMERTSEVVEAAYGEAPRWFRAPYGAWNRDTFQLGAELGMEPLAWTVDTLDWTTPGTGTIVDRVEEGAAPGVVVLSHDAGGNRSQSVRALRRYLPELLDSGYHLTVPRRRLI